MKAQTLSYFTGGWLILTLLVLITARNPNVVFGMGLIFLGLLGTTVVLAIMQAKQRRGWARAVRDARWRPATRDAGGSTRIVLERVAELGDRREILGTQEFETLPSDLSNGAWEAHFVEAWGRAENRAAVRNASLS